MARTSDKSQLILDYISRFIQENGYAPSVREIGAGVGLRSTASVSYHLRALQDKGLLQSSQSKGRKRAIATGARVGQIPVVGMVTAGVPILAVENQEGMMAWDGDPNCFALRVQGRQHDRRRDPLRGQGGGSPPAHRRGWSDRGGADR